MARNDIDEILNPISLLAKEIENFVPNSIQTTTFRADLAGLLVVTVASSYESCVKGTLIRYARNHHNYFGIFIENHFEKLNSRIKVSDLTKYSSQFGSETKEKFKTGLNKKRTSIANRTGKSITSSYDQILDWRHGFAHAWSRTTTIEEALATHRLAKRVLYAFDEAFS